MGDVPLLPPDNSVECFSSVQGTTKHQIWCFAHAGGGAAEFRKWPSLVSSDATVFAVRLPARERRFTDKPFESMSQACNELASSIGPLLIPGAVFYGQCFGAILAFEVAAALSRGQGELPSRIYVASQVAPHDLCAELEVEESVALDDMTEFKRKVIAYAGVPAKLVDNSDFWMVIERALRADFQLMESYSTDSVTSFLPIPIVAFIGDDDPLVPLEGVIRWGELTPGFEIRRIPGGHFLNRTSSSEVIRSIELDWTD
ncbi:MAG: thioesterase [Acidimicrobiaceae bacterium]|nr:thioesterase [Acidimicrobiaceae bacterium]